MSMTQEDCKGYHTITRLTVHIAWVTKYRYHVLKGDIKIRYRELIIQTCDLEGIEILSGVVSKDYVYIHMEYPPSKSISDVVKRLKGRSSLILQQAYPVLKKRYWTSLLGKWLWCLEYRKHNRSNGSRLFTTS
jgi:putative transposase